MTDMKNSYITRLFVAMLLTATTLVSHAEEVCDVLQDAVIIGQDGGNTYLGRISSSFDRDSIFNEFGAYGNEFSGKSIWNEFSTFGNEFNNNSPFNEFSSSPPMLIKNRKLLGYLTSNESMKSAISPNLLKALCKETY
ncbi:MAG: hypothetical protein CVU22_10695 [Betaproteobacteria bacterium HGW-Betaproteobacteria-16]|nr:MAG: hypothetical protein CVU22_10695 [Betaproteobacteria bacterium HGW-Betaproteobacteria-16]